MQRAPPPFVQLTTGITGCSNRRSWSSTWPRHPSGPSGTKAPRHPAPAWTARRTSRHTCIPRRSGRAVAHLGELEPLELRSTSAVDVRQPRQDPAVHRGQLVGRRQRNPSTVAPLIRANRVAFHSLLQKFREPWHPLLTDRHVAAGVGAAGEGEPGGVRAEALDPVQRVDHVAEDFDIFLPFWSRTMPCRSTRRTAAVVHEVQAEHHHPGDPEEQDVVAGHQHAGRIECAGPRSRPASPAWRTATAPRRTRCRARPRPAASRRRRRLARPGPTHDLAVRAVPDRDPVAPPELARDAPVADVVHPVEVELRERGRKICMRPSRTASPAASASGPMLTNHCGSAAARPWSCTARSGRPRGRAAASRPDGPARERGDDRRPRLVAVEPGVRTAAR